MFSKNIFKDIKRLIFDQNNDFLSIRGEHKEKIEKFLKDPNPRTTQSLLQFIANMHKKKYLFDLMNDLRLYEKGFINILPDHREHYLHSASVYVLGLAIYNNCEPIRISQNTERHEDHDVARQKASFLFRWSLAACLHDVAYPLQLSLKSFNRYSTYLHEIKDQADFSFLTVNQDVYDRFNLLPILDPENTHFGLQRKDTAIGLIAHFLTGHRLRRGPIIYETLLEFLKKYFNDNLAIGRIDHGVCSSFIILKRTHDLYKRNKNWDIWNYYYEIVDAATAIFLHNLYIHSKLKDIFGQGIYRYDYPSPLGYLLFLADTLCEWLRGRSKDINLYGVLANDNKIIFKVPPKIYKGIRYKARFLDKRVPVRITTKWTN